MPGNCECGHDEHFRDGTCSQPGCRCKWDTRICKHVWVKEDISHNQLNHSKHREICFQCGTVVWYDGEYRTPDDFTNTLLKFMRKEEP